MFHFLAKLGRSRLGKLSMPVFATSTTFGYLGFQFFGHSMARDMLAAESEPGRRRELSKDLQKLILSVYNDIKSTFNQPTFENDKLMTFSPPPIKWFSSSTLDPVVFGMTETRTGILIGLPNSYEYKEAGDVPATFRQFRLFKTSNSSEKTDSNDEGCETGDCTTGLVTFDKTSKAWEGYVDSMILSEKAKRFSIARELFSGDSYRIMLMGGVIFVSTLISMFLSRAAVKQLNIKDAHVAQRLPFYAVAGLTGFVNYCYLGDALNHKYTIDADKRAMLVSETYREGAIEYFSKLLQRNKALRNLLDDMKFLYDEEGNPVNPPIRYKYMPITERLTTAEKSPQKEATGFFDKLFSQ